MKRRGVLKAGVSLAVLPLLGRAAWADDACAKPKVACERIATKIGGNHGHALQVAVDDVKAGVEKTYAIQGTSGHGHTVTLGAAELERLRAGEHVRLVSSRDGGHKHRVLVRCAPAVDPPEAANVCQIAIGGKDDHEFAITAADVAAKAERTYDIQGVADHTHAVRITADDFQKLARGEELAIKASPGAGHTHVVLVRYAPKPATG